MLKVEQMINSRGNGAMNQFIITDGNVITFQSYESMIATVDNSRKVISIGENYNYSKTTGKHRNIFFSDYVCLSGLATLKGLEAAIKDGFYKEWKVERV